MVRVGNAIIQILRTLHTSSHTNAGKSIEITTWSYDHLSMFAPGKHPSSQVTLHPKSYDNQMAAHRRSFPGTKSSRIKKETLNKLSLRQTNPKAPWNLSKNTIALTPQDTPSHQGIFHQVAADQSLQLPAPHPPSLGWFSFRQVFSEELFLVWFRVSCNLTCIPGMSSKHSLSQKDLPNLASQSSIAFKSSSSTSCMVCREPTHPWGEIMASASEPTSSW